MSLAMRSRPVSTSCSSAFAPPLPRPVSSGAVLAAGIVLAETVHKRFAGLNRDEANDERSRKLLTSGTPWRLMALSR